MKKDYLHRALHRLGLILLILATACDSPKSGSLSATVRTELDRLVEAPIGTEAKYFRFCEKMADLLQESLNLGSASATMANLREFAGENEKALDLLAREFDDWQKRMTDEERNQFVMKLIAQDVAVRLGRLETRFRREFGANATYMREFEALYEHLHMTR